MAEEERGERGIMSELVQLGFAIRRMTDAINREALRRECFKTAAAGTRCLLDCAVVADAARTLGRELKAVSVLSGAAGAIQAVAFDKTADTNWKVTWHQDLMFPLARRAAAEGYAMACVKDGVDFARPPSEVLERLLAVRLHLDDCDERNGPLRVAPGSHRVGIVPGSEIAAAVEKHGERVCLAREGEVLLLRPLLLHASSRAEEPRHRRVLHLVFHDGSPVAEPWHRRVG